MMQEELLSQYLESLKGKILRIESLLLKYSEGNAKAGDNIRLLAHTLHGSGATFGFPEISEAGKLTEFAEKDELGEKLLALKMLLEEVVNKNSHKISVVKEKVETAAQESEMPSPLSTNQQQEVPDKGENSRKTSPLNSKQKVFKILIVDDDPQIAQSIKGILQGLPNKQAFKLVESGSEAQEAIVKNVFDLIVMDLLLPDMDGRELIEQIKIEFQIKTPLLVLSSLQSESVRIECMGLGADKCLTKPFYDDIVLAETRKLLTKTVKKKLSLVPLDGELTGDEDDSGAETKQAYLTGKSILIAEDDKMQASLIRQRLTEEGAAVEHASNGREAMQFLRSKEFSLLILDVNMPVMDGFEVLERIREELKLVMPVIMVTALGSEEDIIKGYDLGATDYILKPYSEVQLFARVKSLLREGKD